MRWCFTENLKVLSLGRNLIKTLTGLVSSSKLMISAHQICYFLGSSVRHTGGIMDFLQQHWETEGHHGSVEFEGALPYPYSFPTFLSLRNIVGPLHVKQQCERLGRIPEIRRAPEASRPAVCRCVRTGTLACSLTFQSGLKITWCPDVPISNLIATFTQQFQSTLVAYDWWIWLVQQSVNSGKRAIVEPLHQIFAVPENTYKPNHNYYDYGMTLWLLLLLIQILPGFHQCAQHCHSKRIVVG